jgi:Ca2+-binding RTX toxin-like protein
VGGDNLSGGKGSDWLCGGAGDDVIVGGPGNDQLKGGSGADVFVFAPGSDKDVIRDLEEGDRIDLTAFDISGFDAIDFSKPNGNVIIDLGDHTSVLLLDTKLASLDAGDFIL